MCNTFIIDCEKKGNVVRFYLGNDPEYHGDDWNDFSYENNCSLVYNEYIIGYKDISFPFDTCVLEPADGVYSESNYSRYDFKYHKVPCIITIDDEIYSEREWGSPTFQKALGFKATKKYYFGDYMEPDVWIKKP